jgi:hypothetical protein
VTGVSDRGADVGFFKQVASALRPSRNAGRPDAVRDPSDADAVEANLDALTPEERAAYEANVAAVAQRRAEAEAASEREKAAHRDGEKPDEHAGEG